MKLIEIGTEVKVLGKRGKGRGAGKVVNHILDDSRSDFSQGYNFVVKHEVEYKGDKKLYNANELLVLGDGSKFKQGQTKPRSDFYEEYI